MFHLSRHHLQYHSQYQKLRLQLAKMKHANRPWLLLREGSLCNLGANHPLYQVLFHSNRLNLSILLQEMLCNHRYYRESGIQTVQFLYQLHPGGLEFHILMCRPSQHEQAMEAKYPKDHKDLKR